MMKIFSLLFVIFAAVSCQSPYTSAERKQLNEYYIQSGVEQYFLADLPEWANVNQTSSCKRTDFIRFFNFSKISESYKLDYEKLLQLQLMFNVSLKKRTVNFDKLEVKNMNKRTVPKEDEVLFFNVLDKIQGGVKEFVIPEFNRVHFVLIDEYLLDPTKILKLKALTESEEFSQGFPVFVSLCSSQREVEQFISVHHFEELNPKIISSELLSPFDDENKLTYGFALDVSKLFKPQTKIYLYSHQALIPKDLKGQISVKKY